MSTLPEADAAPESFEALLTALEREVERLERGELPLEQALAAFERGMSLSQRGESMLAEAERKVELLLDVKGGAAVTQPFGDPRGS